MLWSAADILFVTIELKLFERVEHALPEGDPVVRFVATLLVGYPILVAASGLWFRVWLVWITTGMAMLAYLWLYLDAEPTPADAAHGHGTRALRPRSTPTSSWLALDRLRGEKRPG